MKLNGKTISNGRGVFLALVFLAAFFTACASSPLSSEQKSRIDQISAASFLGDSLVLDVSARNPLLRSDLQVFKVKAWQVDESFRQLLAEACLERGKTFVPLELAPEAVAKALSLRESRWQKVTGHYSQALLDLLFRSADRQGVRYLFLLTPIDDPNAFPLQSGVLGLSCRDRSDRGSLAYVYFKFEFSLWDVGARKKIFTTIVDPKATDTGGFASCQQVAGMQNPLEQLEAPVKQEMGRLVESLFKEMSWEEKAR